MSVKPSCASSVAGFILLICVGNGVAGTTPDPDCTLASAKDVRKTFEAKYRAGDFRGAESYLSLYDQRCGSSLISNANGKEHVATYYWLQSDRMLALYKVGKFGACLKIGEEATEAWMNPSAELEGSKVKAAIETNLQLCKTAREAWLGSFTTTGCPIEKYKSALAIPEAWGFGPREGVCISLLPGAGVSGEEYENLPEDDSEYGTLIDHPRLVLIRETAENEYREATLEFEDGALKPVKLCGANELSLGGDAEKRLVRVSGGASYCWPGSAAFRVDSIYRLSLPGRLKVVDDLLIVLH